MSDADYSPGSSPLPPIQPTAPLPPSSTYNVVRGKSYTESVRNGIVFYPDTSSELTNGRYGSTQYTDLEWQGFSAPNFHYVLDLGAEYEISYMSANYLQMYDAGIQFPHTIKFSYSVDGTNFTDWVVPLAIPREAKTQLHHQSMQRHLSSQAKSKLDEAARNLLLQWTGQTH